VEPVDKRERYRDDKASGDATQERRATSAVARHRLIEPLEERPYSFDRFLGDFLFKVANSLAAEGGTGTALSKTIA
jgi:hypothetical protein